VLHIATLVSGFVYISVVYCLLFIVICDLRPINHDRDGKSVYLGVEPTLGLVTRYYFLSEGCCLKVAVLSLWAALSGARTGL
jgi:hypothetical protein